MGFFAVSLERILFVARKWLEVPEENALSYDLVCPAIAEPNVIYINEKNLSSIT